MRQIKRASRADREIIEQLRISEFNRSSEFKLLKPEKLLWSSVDDASIVLVVIDDKGKAIATMRGITTHSPVDADKIVQCSVPKNSQYPIIIFTSAATLKPLRRNGFNQLLRLYFLKYALSYGIQTLVSPVYKNAPRIEFMASLGYQFITPERNWQTKLHPTSERQLGILTADKFEQAISIIEKRNTQLIIDYPWQGESPPWKTP